MSRNRTILVAAAILAIASGAHATGVLDQNNPPNGLGLNDSLEWQQQVTAGSSGQLVGITLYSSSPTDFVQVTPGAGFYSGPYDFAQTVALSSGGTYIDLSAANIFLSAGQTFVIDVTQGAGCCELDGSDTPYAGGDLYLNAFGGVADYTSQFGYSLGFQSFMASGVPEPVVWAMMTLGLGFAGLALRRRRAALAA